MDKNHNKEGHMKKKTNVRKVIRQIVREEVAMAIGEVITELKQPSQQTQPKVKKKIVEKELQKQMEENQIPNTFQSGMSKSKLKMTLDLLNSGPRCFLAMLNDVLTTYCNNQI